MHKIYTINDSQLVLVDTLRDCQMVDGSTPLIPMDAVIADVALPTKQAKQAYQVSGERNKNGHYTVSNNVSVVADYRNTDTYNTTTGDKEPMIELGDLPSHLTTKPRPSPAHVWQSDKWVIDKAKQAELFTAKKRVVIAAFYVDVDSIYETVIGKRFAEYQTAYDEATIYKKAGYTGTVPPSVQSWVDANDDATKDAKWAADDILRVGDAWSKAQLQMRAHRLAHKQRALKATDDAALEVVQTSWIQTRTAIRTALGLEA